MQQHSTRVPYPFDVVKERFGDLNEAWFENAARASINEAETTGRANRASAPQNATSQVRITLSRPFVGRSVYALPLQWTVAGPNGTWTLKGELEMFQIDAAQTNIGLLLSREPPSTEAAAVAFAMKSFLARVSLAVRGYDNGTGAAKQPLSGLNGTTADGKPSRRR